MKRSEKIDEQALLKIIGDRIKSVAEKIEQEARLMEVCGTHTMALSRYGIKQLLPGNIKLVSGPGCPVCVSPVSFIDKSVKLSDMPETIITTFGDMLRVPGSDLSLEQSKAAGACVRVVYSPLDALDTAQKDKTKKVIFLGAGFETTAPSVAYAIKKAKEEEINNFFVLSSHKLIPPAMNLLLEDKEIRIDGFICPGHVSAIIGSKPYEFIPEKYGKPCVIAGFQPLDIMQSILMLVQQIASNKAPAVEIQYNRAVKKEGNQKAVAMIEEVFDKGCSEWRSIGLIPESGLIIKDNYKKFDAERVFDIEVKRVEGDNLCICGDILKGKKTPGECRFFGRQCIPEKPMGPCMVSSEGTCAAHYKYRPLTGC